MHERKLKGLGVPMRSTFSERVYSNVLRVNQANT